MTSSDLHSKVAVVPGGSGGIGSAICRRLAEAGARVFIGYNSSPDAARSLAQKLVGSGHAAIAMPVTDSDGMMKARQQVQELAGRLDLVVNCAGTTRFVPHGDLDALDDELISRILDVNVRGVIVSSRAFVPLLRQSGGGCIINISSIAGVSAMGSNIAYCASKAAVDNLTKSLSRALAPEIRVLSVSPGLVATEFVRGLDEAWRDLQTNRTPLSRLAQPEEVAEAVFVAAALLTFTTGTVLPVDGGRQLS